MLRGILSVCALGLLLAANAQQSKAEVKVRKALAAGKPYGAIRACDHELTKAGAPLVFYALRAEAHNDIAEYEKARRDALKAMADQWAAVDAMFQLGIAYQMMGLKDSAAIMFGRVFEVVPEAPLRLGMVQREQGKLQDALKTFSFAIEESLVGANNPRYIRERGATKALMGDSAGARMDLDKAIELAPRDPVNYNNRGYYRYAVFGEHQRAITDYDFAIKLDPNYSYAFNNRGWSYYKLGNKEKALKDIRLAGKKKVHNPYVYRNLGVIALESGDKEAACSNFRRALMEGFTEIYGSEVEDLMKADCGGAQAPRLAPPGSAPVPAKTNAPDKTPPKSNAP